MKLKEAIEQAIALDGGTWGRSVTARIHTKDEDGHSVDLAVWPVPNDDGMTMIVYSPDWADLTFKEISRRGTALLQQHIDGDEWIVE